MFLDFVSVVVKDIVLFEIVDEGKVCIDELGFPKPFLWNVEPRQDLRSNMNGPFDGRVNPRDLKQMIVDSSPVAVICLSKPVFERQMALGAGKHDLV